MKCFVILSVIVAVAVLAPATIAGDPVQNEHKKVLEEVKEATEIIKNLECVPKESKF